jgi:hypothetical protein
VSWSVHIACHRISVVDQLQETLVAFDSDIKARDLVCLQSLSVLFFSDKLQADPLVGFDEVIMARKLVCSRSL